MYDYFKLPKENDPETDKMCLIEASAKIITNKIKAVFTSTDEYYGLGELSVESCFNFCLLHYDYFSPAIYQIVSDNNSRHWSGDHVSK